jgi:hypothetical protein
MYKPGINHVLVEIDDTDAKWGKGNDDNVGGEVFREGSVVEFGSIMPTHDYPYISSGHNPKFTEDLNSLISKTIMWNEGHEAGKVFEHEGKKYALIYWWDIVGVKDGE